MFGKKALRLGVATLLVAATYGAQHLAPTHNAAAATDVVSITDWQFPGGCNLLSDNSEVNVEACGAGTLDNLVGIDNKGGYYPDLALNLPTKQNGEVTTDSKGNMVVTWKLKPNLKWSDGSPLTMDDVLFSIPLNIANGNATGIDQITSSKKIDASTAQFTYKGQYAPYIAYGPPGYLYPKAYLEKKYGTTSTSAIASKLATDTYNSPSDLFSGPYKVGSWVNNQSVTLVQNPYYTALPADPNHPRPAQIKFVTVSSEEAVLAQDLQSNKAGVNAAEDFQERDLVTLYGATHYHISVVPGLLIEHLELNEAGVLKDVRLRQALQYAIDKVALVHNLFPDVKDPAGSVLRNPMPIPNVFYDKSQPISEYNPAKAKALLKAAGYSTDYSGVGKHLLLKLVSSKNATRIKDAGILMRDWAEVGVHVSYYPVPATGTVGAIYESWANQGVLQRGNFDIALMAYQESPDPQQNEPNYDPKNIPSPSNPSGQNESRITDTDQFALLQSAGHMLDANQRVATFHKWEALVNSRVYWIPLYNRNQISANDGSIGNYKPHFGQQSNEWNEFQWYKTAASL